MSGVGDGLLREHGELWPQVTGHPFVVAAADGTLAADAFDRWLAEDHFFVVGFRRFLAGLVAIAPDEPARDALGSGLGALQAELELFRSEAAARRLDLTGEPCPTNLGYTSYLTASLADGYEVALTVLYGAERAYFDAWSAVRHGAAAASSPYRAFIDNWSSPAFGAWVDDVAALLDGVAGAPTPDMRVAFGRVVRFEIRFWHAVHAGEPW